MWWYYVFSECNLHLIYSYWQRGKKPLHIHNIHFINKNINSVLSQTQILTRVRFKEEWLPSALWETQEKEKNLFKFYLYNVLNIVTRYFSVLPMEWGEYVHFISLWTSLIYFCKLICLHKILTRPPLVAVWSRKRKLYWGFYNQFQILKVNTKNFNKLEVKVRINLFQDKWVSRTQKLKV